VTRGLQWSVDSRPVRPTRLHQLTQRLVYLGIMVMVFGCDREVSAPAQLRSPGDQAQAVSHAEPAYVGSEVCASCHQSEYERWQGSHHQQAMQVASPDTVLGDTTASYFEYAGTLSQWSLDDGRYVVQTDGADGEVAEFTVRYTFGVAPLQQYLVERPKGRLQALSMAWDSRAQADGGQRWFHLYPDEAVDHTDVLHWTQPAANWNHMCADCHSTAVQKNYDPEQDSYATQFAELSVGCEACHGPGSVHARHPQDESNRPALEPLSDPTRQINACAPCHSRRAQLAEGFDPGTGEYLDHYLPSLLEPGLYHADGQILDEVYVWGSFVQSRMHEQGVTCGDCHDPHSAELRFDGNATCTQCHNPAGRPDFPTTPTGDFEAPEHHFHPSGGQAAQCVSCHMPARVYMVVDPRKDHSFSVPRPDLSHALGVPNACNQCHTDRSPQWAAAVVEEKFGQSTRASFASVIAAGRQGIESAEGPLVALANEISQPAIVRATALSLLVNYSLRGSSVAIERGLKSPLPLVRIGALRGAQRWSADQRWRRTRPLLTDPVLAVRVEAVRGLLNIAGTWSRAQQQVIAPHLDAYIEVLDQNADTAEGLGALADVYLAMGDVAAAEQALRASLEINAQWIPARINLADIYRQTGRDQLAGELLRQANTVSPDNPRVLLAYALWHVRQGQPQHGLPLLARAWRIAPDNPRYAYVYVVALNSTGQPQLALQVADETLSQRSDRQLLEVAFSIARDAGLAAKMLEYQQRL